MTNKQHSIAELHETLTALVRSERKNIAARREFLNVKISGAINANWDVFKKYETDFLENDSDNDQLLNIEQFENTVESLVDDCKEKGQSTEEFRERLLERLTAKVKHDISLLIMPSMLTRTDKKDVVNNISRAKHVQLIHSAFRILDADWII